MIDLQVLNYKDKINIDEEIIIPRDYLENTDIKDLKEVNTVGKISLDNELNYLIQLDVTGKMVLEDAITLDLVDYPFTINIEETLENSIKTLDLISFLWHYIVLEVPLRFTNSEIKKIETENYRVISEEEYSKENNPFKDFFIEREEWKDGCTF